MWPRPLVHSPVNLKVFAAADLGGGGRPLRPRLDQNFLIFMHFPRKIAQIVGWRTLWVVLDPPVVKSVPRLYSDIYSDDLRNFLTVIKKVITEKSSDCNRH